MYFNAGLKVENYIYLIEELSNCLISIYIPSGKAKVEAYLPWRYTGAEIGMLPWKNNILIYSPIMDYFLIYDCLKQKVKNVKLSGIEADEAGFYYSNMLINEDTIIVLPFKGKEIRIYGINGDLKSKDNQWYLNISENYSNKKSLQGNIRTKSACIIEEQVFFSLFYENKNYLCKYILNGKKHKLEIVYNSENVIIKGVYAYFNMVLFRKIFENKTEIGSIFLNSNEKKIFMIDFSTRFKEDIYGDLYYLMGSFTNKILKINGQNLNSYEVIYEFKEFDNYIEKGILFNYKKSEILVLQEKTIGRYLINEIISEIKESNVYQEEYKKLLEKKYILEGKYSLQDLKRYIIRLPLITMSNKNKELGKLIWKEI